MPTAHTEWPFMQGNSGFPGSVFFAPSYPVRESYGPPWALRSIGCEMMTAMAVCIDHSRELDLGILI